MTNSLLYLAGLLGLLVVCDLAIHLVYAAIALRRFDVLPTFRVLPPPQDAPAFEPLLFPTTDGVTLAGGAYFPADGHPRGVVVFCPETGGSFDTVMNYARALVESGFAVISFSFRNQAPSESLRSYLPGYWLTNYEIEDIHAALDFVLAQPQFQDLPIGLMGVSRGAGAALAAGASRPEVSMVWTQGAFSTRGLSIYHALKFVRTVVGNWSRMLPQWHVRTTIWFMLRMVEYRSGAKLIDLESQLPKWQHRTVQFLCGTRDTYVPPALSAQLCELTQHAPENSLWVVPQAKHNMERIAAPREYDRRLVEFYEQMIPAPAPALTGARTVAHH